MFQLVERGTYWWPIKLEEPVAGKHRISTIQGQFAQLPQDEIDDILARNTGEDNEEETGSAGQARLAERVLVGWRDVGGEDGQPLEFTDESRDALLNIPWARRAVILAFLKSQAGKGAKLGN